MLKAHAGHPTCPFCYHGFKDLASVRKHCAIAHKEVKNNKNEVNSPEGWKRPCRFFRNGSGKCTPRSGSCQFDHTVVPDNERELCFHKNACTYKPYCIFFHPEGQGEDLWQTNQRKIARICRYVENGGQCNRSFCKFFHPSVNSDVLGFQWEQLRKPPIVEDLDMISPMKNIPLLPKRIPVIVRNKMTSKEELVDLNQGLKKMNLD